MRSFLLDVAKAIILGGVFVVYFILIFALASGITMFTIANLTS